jgi:hypothetical protein
VNDHEEFHKRYDRHSAYPKQLRGRLVNPTSFDASILRGWLERCDQVHGSKCKPETSPELRHIRLVDVISRTIVPYPEDAPCNYVALSYVWGNVEQDSFGLGSEIGSIPQTIEDAMTVVRELGQRFLFVDSLCIDQRNSTRKLQQIKLMSIIYKGAWATIVALSGECAESGLPRVNMCEKTDSGVVFPQVYSTVDNIRIVSTMPTLAQQISHSPWDKWAWTLQEALLSWRCLYFTKDQVYCCESLDDSKCDIFNNPNTSPSDFGGGLLRNTFVRQPNTGPSMREVNTRFEKYGELLGMYSSRSMTHDSDAINAFSGILQVLESRYYKNGGFCHGLPVTDLRSALLWEWEGQSIRRPGFPPWSWAGWKTSKILASSINCSLEQAF